MMRCPNCQSRIIQRGRDGTLKVRTRMLAIRGTKTEVVCRNCGTDVVLDLTPGQVLLAAAAAAGPRLIIPKDS